MPGKDVKQITGQRGQWNPIFTAVFIYLHVLTLEGGTPGKVVTVVIFGKWDGHCNVFLDYLYFENFLAWISTTF